MTSTLPLPPAPPGMPLSLSASPHVSHLRPSLTPSPSSSLSLTPLHSSSSSSCSTPQRTSSTSSQSSTASIPARPIRPPPIETRTKASKPEQVWGATSLRDALNAATRGSTTANGEAGTDRMLLRGTASGQGSSGATRGKPAGFVVHGGRRGSGGGSVGNAAGKKIAAGQIGPSSFKFGEELGRGSFSVVSLAFLCILWCRSACFVELARWLEAHLPLPLRLPRSFVLAGPQSDTSSYIPSLRHQDPRQTSSSNPQEGEVRNRRSRSSQTSLRLNSSLLPTSLSYNAKSHPYDSHSIHNHRNPEVIDPHFVQQPNHRSLSHETETWTRNSRISGSSGGRGGGESEGRREGQG